ncbi:hypothetical protein HCN44_005546 [Aphidius gifuensis]|uniref:Odorant receptor n=1 Tax=Aphidius gifuensis TaxID=684658 RepID=A0A834Y4Y6_APHGI|nr:hypothetical protein HCN44_005546 [Aphidius gifuensis]
MNDWYCVNDKSRKIMLKYAKIGRIVLIIQFIGAYGSLIPMISRYPSIVVEANGYNNDTILLRSIPLGPRCWIPMTLSWYLYVGYYFLLCIDLLILSTAFVGSDIFVFTIAMHICGQFKILYNSIENINYHKNRKQQCLIIENFVIRHNELIEILEQFEEACNVIIFFEVFANIFVICITGFILLQSFNLSKGQMEFSLIARMFVLFTQLFLYSYIGENLTNRAKNLQSVIYNSNWHDLSPKIIKDMTFIISRSQYEFHLTAGKTRNMNMSNFKDIVKSIFSYLSILRLMFEK